MRRNLSSTILLLLLVSICEAQPIQQSYSIAYLPQGFVLRNLSSIGFNGITRTPISGVLNSNPALLSDFDGVAIGASYQLETKIDTAWFAGMGHARHRLELPQSISLTIPMKNFRFGVGANQLFNSQFDYGEIEGALTWQPDGSFLTTDIHPMKYETIFQFSGGIAYQSNIPGGNGILSIGLQYNHAELTHIMDWGTDNQNLFEDYDFNLRSSNISYGFTYTLTDYYIPLVRIAFFQENKFEFTGNMSDSNVEIDVVGYVPKRNHFGIMLQPNDRTIITGDYSVVEWNDINAFKDKLLNTHEFSANIGYELNRCLTTSIGLFATDHQRKDEADLFAPYDMKATYLLLGVQYVFDHVEFDVSFVDSHFRSEDWRKQSIIKVGLGFKIG